MTAKIKDKGRKLNWKQACEILGCGKTKFFDMVNSGQLPGYRTGLRGLFVYEADARAIVRRVDLESENRPTSQPIP